jgi:hypothetical protein
MREEMTGSPEIELAFWWKNYKHKDDPKLKEYVAQLMRLMSAELVRADGERHLSNIISQLVPKTEHLNLNDKALVVCQRIRELNADNLHAQDVANRLRDANGELVSSLKQSRKTLNEMRLYYGLSIAINVIAIAALYYVRFFK